MIISHTKKFIFIHIYKTAGTSISKVLLPHARLIDKISSHYPSKILIKIINFIFNLEDNGNEWINGVHKHATALEIKKYLNQKIFEEYYKFAFVRHPMDWQVSLYEYIKNNSHRDQNLAQKISFKEFALREIENNSPRQIDFLRENDLFIVDKFYKFENIDKELKELFKILNISSKIKKIEKLNKSPRKKNFYEYYDKELEKAVRDYYSEDFKLFGYD